MPVQLAPRGHQGLLELAVMRVLQGQPVPRVCRVNQAEQGLVARRAKRDLRVTQELWEHQGWREHQGVKVLLGTMGTLVQVVHLVQMEPRAHRAQQEAQGQRAQVVAQV